MIRHGATKSGQIHPLYRVWYNMMQRCTNSNHPQFADYGGRGIKVCKEWSTYVPFRDYVITLPNCPKEAQTPNGKMDREIDRIKNALGYKPGNVRWGTRVEQSNNRRSNRMVRINGETLAFKTAVEKFGKVSYRTAAERVYRRGWTPKAAILTPSKSAEFETC